MQQLNQERNITALVPAMRGLMFAVARTGMAETQRLSYTTSHHFQGREKGSFPMFRVLLVVNNCAWIICLSYALGQWYCCCYLAYFIDVSGKSFLSPPMIFAFYPFNSPLQLLQEDRRIGRGRREWVRELVHGLKYFHMVWSVLVRALNWEIPFLNRVSDICVYLLRTKKYVGCDM